MRSFSRPSTVSARFLRPRRPPCGRRTSPACAAADRSLRARRSKIRSSATCTSSGAIRCSGRIFETCTIAPLMPARTAWSRNTQFSTARAAGFSPKLTLDRPRMIWMSGNSARIAAMPSSVHCASLRSSSLPVAMVKVSGSISRSDCGSPCLLQAKSTSRRAMRSLSLGGLRHADLVDGQRDHRRRRTASPAAADRPRASRHPRS